MYLFERLVYSDSDCAELLTSSTRISSTLILLQFTLHSPREDDLLAGLLTNRFNLKTLLLKFKPACYQLDFNFQPNLTSFHFQPRFSLIYLPDGKTVKLVSSCDMLMKSSFEPFKLAWQSNTNLIKMNSAGRLLLAKLILECCLLGFKLVLQFPSQLSQNA